MTGVVEDSGKELDAQLTISDSAAAYEFWKKSLPTHGYQVSKAEMAGGFGEIDFTGPGCVSGSQIAIAQSSASVQCVQQ